jgi:hypothetical protein
MMQAVVVVSAVIRRGTAPLAGLRRITGCRGLEDKCSGFGNGVLRRQGNGLDRQIRYQGPELTACSHAVGLAEPVVQRLQIDAAFGGGNPQCLGDGLLVRVRRLGRVARAHRSR